MKRFLAGLEKAIAAVERGDFIEEEMDARIEQMISS
jgi:hypothetical protein